MGESTYTLNKNKRVKVKAKNKIAKTIVTIKMPFSTPRLVLKTLPSPPKIPPNPELLFCSNMLITKSIDTTMVLICIIFSIQRYYLCLEKKTLNELLQTIINILYLGSFVNQYHLIEYNNEMVLSDNLLDDLNTEQQQAVIHKNGPLLILAGAGSGKTKTLVYRLVYLIREQKIPPTSIVAVTFTNKATQEMRQRAWRLLAGQYRLLPLIGTFHSISSRWLRREVFSLGRRSNFTIYNDDDQRKLIRQIGKQLNLSPKKYSPGAIQAVISRAKSDLITPVDFLSESDHDHFRKTIAEVFNIYESSLRAANAFDFDDLINKMVEVWSRDKKVLTNYQNKFTHLLVDEYQDTNKAQYEWTRLLAGINQNLAVVGDDWQSIYSWRGADFGNILRFASDYPQARVIKLEQNYRSTKNIIAAGNAVMLPATRRTDKKLWTNNDQGKKITVVETIDENHEAQFVLSQILSDIISGDDLKLVREDVVINNIQLTNDQLKQLEKYAILYRTNAQSRVIEEALLKAGLPYQLIGGVKFYDRKEVKDILAYLRLLVNPYDVISFARALVTPRRGIGEETIDKIINQVQKYNFSPLDVAGRAEALGLPSGKVRLLSNWSRLIKDFRNKAEQLAITDLIEEIISTFGLNDEWNDGSSEGGIRLENVAEFKAVAAERVTSQGLGALAKFLEEISLWQDQDNFSFNFRGVTLMTLHAAKGLEFSVVFMVGMEEGLFPHNNSLNSQDELDEERRLAYVGITRAKEKVYLIYTTLRTLIGTSFFGLPSRFIGDIPEELIDWRRIE